MEFVIISGLSGAGKSRTASIMEDMGFYCVDNIPGPLISNFAEHCMASGNYDRVALVVDIRGGQQFDTLFADMDAIQASGADCHILFIEANDEAVIKRYKETRRTHPLVRDGRGLTEALALERNILSEMRRRALYTIDTSYLSAAKLKDELYRIYGKKSGQELAVRVVSFGFKYGLPLDADLVFDVRFLPNPYYKTELRYQTGLDAPVAEFVGGFQQTEDFMHKLTDLISFLLPQYVEEGKTNLVIAIGCTGGKHRSVALTHALAEFIVQRGYAVSESHRDLARENR